MLIIIIATAFLSTSCSKDDKKDTPQPVQQEDPMAYMTEDFLRINIVGTWISDSAFNTSSTGYGNEQFTDTLWINDTTWNGTWEAINPRPIIYYNYSIFNNEIQSNVVNWIEFMDIGGTTMNIKLHSVQNLPNYDKRVVRYFKQ